MINTLIIYTINTGLLTRYAARPCPLPAGHSITSSSTD